MLTTRNVNVKVLFSRFCQIILLQLPENFFYEGLLLPLGISDLHMPCNSTTSTLLEDNIARMVYLLLMSIIIISNTLLNDKRKLESRDILKKIDPQIFIS